MDQSNSWPQISAYSIQPKVFFYFPSQTFNNIVKQKGFPLPKYKASGNLLQQYFCNIVWQYYRNIAAILDFICKLVSGSIAAITLSGNIVAILPKLSTNPVLVILLQYCQKTLLMTNIARVLATTNMILWHRRV